MNSRPKQPKYARNKNILVIGGSGSGKTRFFVKPNLMQMHSSYVVTDPKGTVLVECGKLLQRGGYRIKVLNTINFKKSMRYNPFAYLRSEKDILKLVNTLIANTKGDGEKAGEDFWVKSERLFYCALIGYIWYEAPEEEKNFTTLLEMINASEAREDDPEFQSPVDLMFERLEEKDPEHFAVRQYKKFLLSAGKTRSSILISCGARLAPFDIKELRDLMETDEMELDTIGDRKGNHYERKNFKYYIPCYNFCTSYYVICLEAYGCKCNSYCYWLRCFYCCQFSLRTILISQKTATRYLCKSWIGCKCLLSTWDIIYGYNPTSFLKFKI